MRTTFLLLPMMLVVSPLCAQVSAADDTPRITVSGEALVKVAPDKVDIRLGIETLNLDIAVAKRENSEILQRVIASMRKLGVEDRNVQTAHLSIEPVYEHNRRIENLVGYIVRNAISVVLTDPDQVEPLLSRALEDGVTHVHGVEFQTTAFKEHRRQARVLALKAAREKAEEMSAVLGKSVGDPLQITESRQYGSYYSGWWGRGGSSGMSQNVMQDTGAGGSDVGDTVALGKIGIRASVSVVFSLK